MKKLFAVLTLSTIICLTSLSLVEAKGIEKTIPITNIEILQGLVSHVDDEYIYIDTIDANGWVLEVTEEETEQALFIIEGELVLGDTVVVVFDNMGTDDIYDDEIISILTIN